MQFKNFYKFYCLMTMNYADAVDDDNKPDSIISYKGIYLENHKDALDSATLIKNEVWVLGVIDKIQWDCCPYITIEDLQKKFPHFIVGKYLNINELKYILLFLKQQLNMDYIFNITINKNKPERVKVVLKEKEGEKFVVTKVLVKGNRLLQKADILEAINPALCPINILEKIKWLIFKKTGAIVTGVNMEQAIERLAKNLGDSSLLLDLKTKVEFKKNVGKNGEKTVVATVTITEGSKYFINKIYLDKRIQVNKKQLRLWLEKKGFSGGNFDHLKEFFQAYNYFNLNIYHKIDGNYIDIYVGVHNAEFSQMVEMITYSGFSDVSMNYIYKHLKVRINEPYNRHLMEEFLYKQSILLNATITQGEIGNIFNRINVKIIKTAKEEEQNFFTTKDSDFVFQYKISKPLYEMPNLIMSFTPELYYGDKIKLGGRINIIYNLQNLWKLQLFDGEILLNLQAIKDGDRDHIFQNISVTLMELTNHFNSIHNLRWNIAPLNIVKAFNSFMLREAIKTHIYVYMKGRVQKVHTYSTDIRRVKFSNFVSAKYFFGHNVKLKYNPEFRYPITKYLHILGSLRILYNSKTIDVSTSKGECINDEIFLHLSSINSGDMMGCLLWKSHFTKQEMDKFDICTAAYLKEKEIILSNFVLNFRLMLNYIILKTTLPSIGKIQLSIFLFVNFVYDHRNNLQRYSYGTGLMGVYNTNGILFAIGKKYAPNTNNPGLNYTLTFENYAF